MTAANPHLRAILIAGALAATAVALGFYTLSRQQLDSSATAPVVVPHAPARPHVAAKPQVVAKPHTAAKPQLVAKPHVVAKRHVAARPQVDPAVRAALAAGLPPRVAQAFAGRTVVVVSLYDPASPVDSTARAEARAGAQLAGAGFVAVDASREGTSGRLVETAGLLAPPAALVYAQPDFKLATRLDGFADRQTVAQAARNADPAADGAVAQTAWARRADSLCDTVAADLSALDVKTPQDLVAATPGMQAAGRAFLAGLGRLDAPAGREADVAEFVRLETENVAATEQLVAATAKQDTAAAGAAGIQQSGVSRQANALALSLGATHCAGAL